MNKHIYPDISVLLFAKAPVLGQVKTRLQSRLGADGALSLHKKLIAHAVLTVMESSLCRMELWVSSNIHDEVYLTYCNKADIYEQCGDDLGARMAHAAANALQRSSAVILLGTDCPSVDAAYLKQAMILLEQGEEIVFGPAEDGGYVLLALRRVPSELFTNMPWGSADVMAMSRDRLRQAGLRWVEMATRWDVDRPEDLLRLQKDLNLQALLD